MYPNVRAPSPHPACTSLAAARPLASLTFPNCKKRTLSHLEQLGVDEVRNACQLGVLLSGRQRVGGAQLLDGRWEVAVVACNAMQTQED